MRLVVIKKHGKVFRWQQNLMSSKQEIGNTLSCCNSGRPKLFVFKFCPTISGLL